MRLLWFEFEESVRIAVEQLGLHRTRALLTALGVIIGIVAVTLMGTAIRGIDKGFNDSLAMLGTDILHIQQWPWSNPGENWARFRNRPAFRASQAAEINRIIADTPDSELLVAVPGVERWWPVKHREKAVNGVRVYGTTADFALTTTAEFAEGRLFNTAETLSGANVIVLGYDVADTLFEGRSAIGEIVRLREQPMEVIGVFARQGSFLGLVSFDNQAVVPLGVIRRFDSSDWGTMIQIKVRPGANKWLAEEEARGTVRRVRGLMPGVPDNFEINKTEMLEDDLGPIKSGIALAGIFITGLALFVGAIGIMNITFVSVRERTREIGTRRALGARRRSILMQFLIEAVSICLIGGAVGLSLTFGLQRVVAITFPKFPLVFSPDLLVIALLVSILTGVASGFAPAWTAARLDPAHALRHE